MAKDRPTNHQGKNAAKKAAVLGTEKKSRRPIILAAAVLLTAAGAAGWLLQGKGAQNGPVEAVTSSESAASVVTLPAGQFEDGKARHFEHVAGGLTIRYFVLKSSDGVIRAAFDACDVCWPAGKGYFQDGDVMVCRNCGRRFASVLINEVQGGCNPAPLARILENGKVVIQVKDIAAGRQYFDFSGKA